MKINEIPEEILDILDERAGKKHSRQGPVVSALAEILTVWEDKYCGQISNRLEELSSMQHVRRGCSCTMHVCGKTGYVVTAISTDAQTAPRKTKKIPPNDL